MLEKKIIYSSSPSNLGTSANTFLYDHNEGEWITGPSLMNPRFCHAAGIVTDLATDEQLVAVTGGWSCDVLISTEILHDGEWVQGKMNKCILNISKSGPANSIQILDIWWSSLYIMDDFVLISRISIF